MEYRRGETTKWKKGKVSGWKKNDSVSIKDVTFSDEVIMSRVWSTAPAGFKARMEPSDDEIFHHFEVIIRVHSI